MKDFPIKPESILGDSFVSIQQYIQDLIEKEADLMTGLTNFVTAAWEVPKKYKGHSGQMGFIPEYLVFETLRQYIAKKNKIAFFHLIRSKTLAGIEETYYFVDSIKSPTHQLCQGLRVYEDKEKFLNLPRLD